MKEILVLKNPIESGKTHIIGKVYDKIQKNLNLSPRPIHLPAPPILDSKIPNPNFSILYDKKAELIYERLIFFDLVLKRKEWCLK